MCIRAPLIDCSPVSICSVSARWAACSVSHLALIAVYNMAMRGGHFHDRVPIVLRIEPGVIAEQAFKDGIFSECFVAV